MISLHIMTMERGRVTHLCRAARDVIYGEAGTHHLAPVDVLCGLVSGKSDRAERDNVRVPGEGSTK